LRFIAIARAPRLLKYLARFDGSGLALQDRRDGTRGDGQGARPRRPICAVSDARHAQLSIGTSDEAVHPRPHAGRCRHQRRAFLSDHAEPLLDLCQRIRPELTCLGDRGLPLLDVMTVIERLARTVESGRYQSGSPG
jgi:hypothetical protein